MIRLRPLSVALAFALALPGGATAGRVCPPVKLSDPLPGVEAVTLHQSDVSTAQFPGQWQEGVFGEAKLAYRLFSDGSGTVSSDLRLRGWHVDFTCNLQTQLHLQHHRRTARNCAGNRAGHRRLPDGKRAEVTATARFSAGRGAHFPGGRAPAVVRRSGQRSGRGYGRQSEVTPRPGRRDKGGSCLKGHRRRAAPVGCCTTIA